MVRSGGVQLVDGITVTDKLWADVNSVMHDLVQRVEQIADSTCALPTRRHTVSYVYTASDRARTAMTRKSGNATSGTWELCATTLHALVSKIEQNASVDIQISALNDPATPFPEAQPMLCNSDLLYIHEKQFVAQDKFPWQGVHVLDRKLPLNLGADNSHRASTWYKQEMQRVKDAQQVYSTSLAAIKSGIELSGEPQQVLRTTLETFFTQPIPPLYFEFNTLNRSEVSNLLQCR